MNVTIAWRPPRALVQSANVTRLMHSLHCRTWRELSRRSVRDIAAFWGAVEKDLGLHWLKPYRRVVDLRRGIAWPRWFVGGQINLSETCVDQHAQGARRHKLALLWEGEDGEVRKLTYLDLQREVTRAAAGFRALGIRKGDAVGVFMPMLPETAVALMAIARVGALFIPIFSGYGARAAASRLADCSARILVTADGFLRRGTRVEMQGIAEEAARLSGCVEHRIVVPRFGRASAPGAGTLPWDAFLSRGKGWSGEVEPTESEDPWMVIYTSGTTGRPKGSVHVHGGFTVKVASEMAYSFDLKDTDLFFWFTDMGWIMGPWEVVGAWALGGTLFFYEGAPDHPGPDRLWSLVERHAITTLGISPTLIRALMRHGEEPVRRHDLSSLRLLGSTGEPWNPTPWRWFFEQVGQGRCPIINISGGTEVAACFLAPLPIMPQKACSLGPAPSLGMDIEVFGETGQPVRGRLGELVVRQPWPGMTRGLWKDPNRYLEAYWSKWKDVWVHGDWASVDKDGYWFLHGRSDDTIKVAGKRLGPAEVESLLAAHPAVTESAAIGVPDPLKGESLVCLVVVRPEHSPNEDLRRSLEECVAEGLGKALRPKAVRFVRELPKTRNAKILRRVARAAYLGEAAGDLSSLENPKSLDEIRRST